MEAHVSVERDLFRSAIFTLLMATTAALAACGGDSPSSTTTGAVTYWQDVAPIYNDKCAKCHQADGIGPFRLDDYTSAKEHSKDEAAMVMAGLMPPYQMVHDGTCGSFNDDVTLSEDQKATIKKWVDGGAVEGTKVTLTLAKLPQLENATELKTPMFAPT